MEISSEVKDSITVVRLQGNLDTNTSTDAQEYLNRTVDDGAAKVVICFDQVDFVSSAGLRVLLTTAKKLGGAGRGLRVCGLNETVAEVFEISGFSVILNVFGTEAEALEGF